jgi:hypothetical protein
MVYLCYIIVFQRASGVVQVEGKSSLFTTIGNRITRTTYTYSQYPIRNSFWTENGFLRISKYNARRVEKGQFNICWSDLRSIMQRGQRPPRGQKKERIIIKEVLGGR